ncbi:rRNA maturation RNase YbeY [Clostridium sp. MD294]|uniref:rRNA maturation RNase YbeY n=1 Tax=Clostridium sp. MD294 TaxID=97138 RepID=UPI0002CB979A|nr:rRNA maturation RNase YbeY [Clostridium sp. MD294]NDO47395.1 rRNA maturation RNase YbeY [Clostridium sp. MD294]USF29535.1 Endoribonuclease YbeY [Clostridium sp. MD294]
MTLYIDNRTTFEWGEKWEEIVKKAVRTSLDYEEFEKKNEFECEISVSIVTNEEIQKLNKEFRNIDKATDVLSFPMCTFDIEEVPDYNENDEIILGDIVISIDKAKEQSEEYGHSLEREIAFLTVHSMLHLMGYDHMEVEEEKEMIVKQKEILQQAGFII